MGHFSPRDPAFSRFHLSPQDSGQVIPLIVESCIRFINLYGLQHQGIFRVSGSQVEVNDIKNSFERGENPLSDEQSNHDQLGGRRAEAVLPRAGKPPLS